MINHKSSIKRQCRSSLLASVALLLGGALSISSAVQAQETTIYLGIGSELGVNDVDGPQLRALANSTSGLTIEYMAANSTIFTASVHTENRGANSEFHFAYLYGKGELKSDSNVPAFASGVFPRSYLEITEPFRYRVNTRFYDNAKKATRVETGLHFEYRSYYSTELLSRSGVTLSAYGGFGVAANYFNANTVYETSSGSTYAETNQRELGVRVTPLLGTTVQYGFANGHYLKSIFNMPTSTGIGYAVVENDVVKDGNGNIFETFKNRSFSDRSGLDAYLVNANTSASFAYGTDQIEFIVGRRDFRAAYDFKAHMYFEVGFKF